MGITAKELAGKLNLSEAAVSLALNHKNGVSSATRSRVMEAAREYGYDFSKRKAPVHTHRTRSVCMVVYKKTGAVVNDTPFFASVTEGVSIGCRKQNCDMVVRYIYEDEQIDAQVERLNSLQLDGIILLATEMDAAALQRFSIITCPIVLLDCYLDVLPYNCILINNIQGAYLATSYLISKRRAQPGYLRSAYRISNFDERADGFYRAIRAHGMSTSKSVVHRLTPSQEGAYADMKELIHAGETLAKSYFADNDLIAAGAIQAFKEAGYRIPEDIGVVGFDDMPFCEYFSPPLTTISVHKHYIGEVAAQRLVQILEDRDSVPIKVEINTTLKQRKSV